MKLSDIMSNSGLSIYAQIALVLFVGAFIGISLTLWLRKKEFWQRQAALPLEDQTAIKEKGC